MKSYFLLICLLTSICLYPQGIDIKWSEQIINDNNLDGFFDRFEGANKSNVYAKFSNRATTALTRNHDVKLVAFDKTTMKKAGDVVLKGWGEDSHIGYHYYKCIIFDNMIYVLWVKRADEVIELYAESFDSNLSKINSLKKVYEIKGDNTDRLIILSNRDIGGKILIGQQFPTTNDGEQIKLEYKFMDSDFSFLSSRQVALPFAVSKKPGGIFSDDGYSDGVLADYRLGKDGNLYVQEVVKASSEDRKAMKKGETTVYPFFLKIDLASGQVVDYSVKFPNKNTFNVSWLVTNDGLKLFGFFSDLEKDEKGKDTHGTFFVLLDNKTLKTKTQKFWYFDKPFLDVLYASDKENQKRGGGLFNSQRAKESDDESLDAGYNIEEVIEDKNDVVLFCSIVRNWSELNCNGSKCRTLNNCQKENVTVFKLNANGEMVWAKNIDRYIKYNGLNVHDLNIIKTDYNYYVTFGSSYQVNENNKKSKNSKDILTDRLKYAVISTTGDVQEKDYNVNSQNGQQNGNKLVAPSKIEVFDNKLYTSYMRSKLKPSVYFSCLCPPVFIYLFSLGQSQIGKGYLGTISALK